MFSRSTSSLLRVAVVAFAALAALAVVAGCSSSSSSGDSGGDTVPTVAPDKADPASGWNKESLAAVHALADKVDKGVPGGCTGFKAPVRTTYVRGLKRVHGPVPDAVGRCTALDEDLEISVFPSSSVRDDFVKNRGEKLCALSKEKNIGLPGLYWVVGGNWSIQPDDEGVSRRVAHVLGGDAKYEPTGCDGKNPGWDPTAVATLEQTASKLHTNKLGCADFQVLDRDLVSRTVPYNVIGTAAASANCTLTGGATIVFSAYNTPAAKTDQLIRGELGRECVGSNTQRIVRDGNVALFASTPAIADKIKDAVGGSLSPLVCKDLK